MTETPRPAVLFVCSKNGGKSQLAAGLMRPVRKRAVTVYSAGTKPGKSLNPQSVESLTELGIDITGEHPKPVTDEVLDAVDVVIVLGNETKVEAPRHAVRGLGYRRALRTRHRRHGTHAPGPRRHQGPGPKAPYRTHRELGRARPGAIPDPGRGGCTARRPRPAPGRRSSPERQPLPSCCGRSCPARWRSPPGRPHSSPAPRGSPEARMPVEGWQDGPIVHGVGILVRCSPVWRWLSGHDGRTGPILRFCPRSGGPPAGRFPADGWPV